jgi:hypothetical protein
MFKMTYLFFGEWNIFFDIVVTQRLCLRRMVLIRWNIQFDFVLIFFRLQRKLRAIQIFVRPRIGDTVDL